MRKTTYFIVAILAGLWGCQTEPDSAELIDQMVVSTNYDPEADFTAYTTYAIPTDTIGFVSNNSEDTIITYPESRYPRHVLGIINANMEARGYTWVARNANPDIGVNVMVVNDFNVFQEIVYPNYYGYPGNYYSGYYGYGSYYSYPYVNTYAYNTGVLIIELVDLKNKTPDNKVKVVWDAYLGDVYSTIDRNAQTEEAIDQAFIQSPYIGK
ncbi:MAG: DUF4136 domain-containing protein [Cyclobacteriaceae bacterium]